jgi:hypothetical protein
MCFLLSVWILMPSVCLHHLVVIHIVSCALCLACVSLSTDHSDQQSLIILLSLSKYMDVSILVNKTMHKIVPCCSLFVLWMLQRPAKSSVSAVSMQNLFYYTLLFLHCQNTTANIIYTSILHVSAQLSHLQVYMSVYWIAMSVEPKLVVSKYIWW